MGTFIKHCSSLAISIGLLTACGGTGSDNGKTEQNTLTPPVFDSTKSVTSELAHAQNEIITNQKPTLSALSLLECTSTTTFKDMSWKIISLPCDPNGRSIGELFSKAGFGETYGEDWAIHEYIPSKGFRRLNLVDKMDVGKGYWFYQSSGKDVTFSLSGLPIYKTKIKLSSNSQHATWHLVGHTLPKKTTSTHFKLYSESSNNKISWKDASDQNLVHHNILTLKDGSWLTRDMTNPETTIDPWEGFWVATTNDFNKKPVYISTPARPPQLKQLLGNSEISESFITATNHDIEGSDYFGVNPMIAKGNTLYFGVGKGLPAGQDGAILAKYTDGDISMTVLKTLNEQGVMTLSDYGKNGIAVPGVDPCCGDLLNDDDKKPGRYNHQWDWGNFYVLNTNSESITKHRNLPNVIHGWGSWYDEANNTLYYAGSGGFADTIEIENQTLTGFLFKTTDRGATWTKVADRSDGIGEYRTYDIIGINTNLYAQYNDSYEGSCGITKSIDKGQTWKRIADSEVRCATRLYNINNHLVALNKDANAFIDIDTKDKVSSYKFSPLFKLSAYHTLAHDSDGNIYVGTIDGRVMRTRDFIEWNEIARVYDPSISFNTITYWAEKKWLILSNWGDKANLWKLPVEH